MKKVSILLIIILSIALIFTGCSAPAPSQSPATAKDDTVADLKDFTLTIVAGENVYTFTKEDLAALTLKEFETETMKGEELDKTYWKGVSFSDVFALKNITFSAGSSFVFTSLPPGPDIEPFVQRDNTGCSIDSYYLALFLKDSDSLYKVYNISIKDKEGNKAQVSGIRNICTEQNYKTYWVKGLAKIEIINEE